MGDRADMKYAVGESRLVEAPEHWRGGFHFCCSCGIPFDLEGEVVAVRLMPTRATPAWLTLCEDCWDRAPESMLPTPAEQLEGLVVDHA